MANAMQIKGNWSKCRARKDKKWKFKESLINRGGIKKRKKLIRNWSAKYCAESIIRFVSMDI